jgi:hypothetical protein
LPEKTLPADTMLASIRFQIDPGAPVGMVAFDPGVSFGEDLQPQVNFEVLAIPEASTWSMLLAGLLLTAGAVRRKATR